jgi:fructuronate reductase
MTLMVSLKPDGSMEREVVASIAEGLRAGRAYPQDMEKLRTIFRPHPFRW